MASRKRKHKHQRRSHRGGRIGAVGSRDLEGKVVALAGVVIGSSVAAVMQRNLTSVNPKLLAVGQMIGGMWATGKVSPLIQGIGWGVAGAGALNLTHEVGLIHGLDDLVSGTYQALPAGGGYMIAPMSGISNDSRMSGIDNFATMSGKGNNDEDDDDEQDYFRPQGM